MNRHECKASRMAISTKVTFSPSTHTHVESNLPTSLSSLTKLRSCASSAGSALRTTNTAASRSAGARDARRGRMHDRYTSGAVGAVTPK